ncbi:MAG: hypothetical protein JSS29_19075 [Proteobacteria bacterium]|nr:hypothetical protein [Pseudomonadota bacterium]
MRNSREQPPGEPSAGTEAPRSAPLRLVLAGLGTALALALLALLARELIVARIPQDRAALEQLIHDQTGLTVRFARLVVRWGWYGPEAQLTEVTLADRRADPFLVARELTLGIDTWQSLRSGTLEAARIRVRGAEIDLGALPGAGPAGAEAPLAEPGPDLRARFERWRGGRIDVDQAQVRLPTPTGTALTLSIGHARLIRRGSEWGATADLVLPDRLGGAARLAAHVEGDLEARATLNGSVTLAADHLDLGGWRTFAPREWQGLLPQAGEGRVDLEMQVRQGEAARIAGLVRTRELRWAPRVAAGAPLDIAKLDADAQLTRTARGEWRLALGSLDTGVPGNAASAFLMLRGPAVRGNLHALPVQTLAALAAWAAPDLPSQPGALAGEVRSLNFDWDPTRAQGARVAARAEGTLDLRDAAAGLRLTGVDVALTLTDTVLDAQVRAEDARLLIAHDAPAALDGLRIQGELHGIRDAARWSLHSDGLEILKAPLRVQARGLVTGVVGAAPQLHAGLSLAQVSLTQALAVLPAQTLAPLAAAVRARDGRIVEGHLEWQGALAAPRSRGSLELTGAALAAHAGWPGVEDLGGRIEWQDGRVRARLKGARLQPVAGFAPIEGLHGTLAFVGGRLQPSALSGTWLGGAVSLQLDEPSGSGDALAVRARGTLAAPALLAAAGLAASGLPLSGTSDWNVRLRALPAGAGGLRWQARGEASLVGLASRLPEPLTKTAGASLPLRIAAEGRDDSAQLRLTLGTRLSSSVALARAAGGWRIARGALALDEPATVPPPQDAFTVRGHLARLDLPQQVALWRASAALLPPLTAHLSAGELVLGEQRFVSAVVDVHAGATGAQLDVTAPGFDAAVQWPLEPGSDRPVRVQISALAAAQADALLAPALATLAAGPVQVGIGALSYGGRPLGRLEARLRARNDGITVSDLRLAAPGRTLEGSGGCVIAGECVARLSLEGTDLAGLLATFGFRADTAARRVAASAELRWPQGSGAPLATLSGHLHMLLEEGTVHAPEPGEGAPALALLVVPALMDGLAPEPPAGTRPETAPALRFARLGADYTLRDGVAITDNLHLDGDAEILVRARVGLLRQDYDGEAFILRGEERLPQAVRGMGPTPKVAALWLSLRDWFARGGREGAHTVLRLRGPWNDPIVSPVDPKEPAFVPDTP